MALLETAAILGAVVLVGGAAAVVGRFVGVDPMASFAATMAAGFLGVVGYVLAAGAGVFDPSLGLNTLLSTALGVVLLGSLATLRRMDATDSRWVGALRSRLLLGVPWGTITAIGFVLAIYLFLQNGLDHWRQPVTISYRAWSYQYPLGIVTSGFAHNGPGHLIGNLIGTVVFGSMAEYAWGHFPDDRGSSSFESLSTNPWVRAFVLFPGAVVVAGVFMGLFSMGPVIGFSGVVFAFLGFAVARYPLATVAATVANEAVRELFLALRNPIFVSRPAPAPPAPPSWARIAIQIHALGLLLGIALGAYVFWKRSESQSPLRVWVGVALVAVTQRLWAVYWLRGNNEYVLFRGPGLVLVAAFAIVVTAALVASRRPIEVPWIRGRDVSTDGGPPAGGGTPTESGFWDSDISYRVLAVLFLVLTMGVLAGAGAASNSFTADAADTPDDAVQVRDFEVYYAEDVTNQRIAIVNLSFFNETTQVRTSGVIVTSPDRGIWQTVVRKDELAFTGARRVRVGGVGWDRAVLVSREGWSAAGGPAAYKVYLRPEGGERRLVHVSQPARAAPTVAGRNVSVLPGPEGFVLLVTDNGSTVGTTRVPGDGESVRTGGIRFVRQGSDVYAMANGTRVKVASKETYE